MQIHEIFNRQFKENDLEPWLPSTHGEAPAIDTNNRYFTPKRDFPRAQSVAFLPMVDPKGTLTRIANTMTDFIHTLDNQVHYYKYAADATGIKGYVKYPVITLKE
jgi:hypothetical protein